MFGFIFKRTKFFNGLCPIKQRPSAYYFFLKPSVTPEGLLERRKALAALVLFVGSRYYLRPIILWNHLDHLEPFGTPQATGTRLALLERRIAAIRVRVCDGNAMRVR